MKRWLVTVYGKDEAVLDSWMIEDRTEKEAFKEAEPDIAKIEGVEDWTLSDVTNDMSYRSNGEKSLRERLQEVGDAGFSMGDVLAEYAKWCKEGDDWYGNELGDILDECIAKLDEHEEVNAI